MTRTALFGRLFAALLIVLAFGCQPGLDKGHPVPQTERAIDDVKFWTAVEDEKAHPAAMAQLALVPQKLRELRSSAANRKKDEKNKWKALEDKGEDVTEKKALAKQAWEKYETLYQEYQKDSSSAALKTLVKSYDASTVKYSIVEGLIAFSSMAREDIAAEKTRAEEEDGYTANADLISRSEQVIQDVAPVLVKAISNTDEPDLAWEAAEELLRGEISPEMSKQVIAVLADLKAPVKNRWAASRIMAEAPVNSAVDTLISILDGDPDIYPIVLISDAAAALGKLARQDAIPGLIRCLWLNDDRGRNANQACRIALNRIAKAGPEGASKVLAALQNTLNRKNVRVEKRAERKRYDQSGIVEAQIANLLGDKPIANASSVDALINTATTILVPPAYIKGHPTYETEFQKGNVQKTISSAMALAYIGTPAADSAVYKLVRMADNKDPNRTDEEVEKLLEDAKKAAEARAKGEDVPPVALPPVYPLEFRLTAIEQLAFLGSATAIDGLLEIVRTDEGEPNAPEMGDLHALQFQALKTAVFLVDPANADQLKKVDTEYANLKALYTGWLEKMKADVNAAPESAKDALKQRQEIGKANVENQLKFLNDEMDAYLTQVKSCQEDPACWDRVLPTDDRARHYMRNHRLQRAVIEAAKSCKSEADKSKCLAEKIPAADKAEALAKAYDAIASTFKKSNDPQIPGKVREDKLLSASVYVVDTALFCKADEKCWKELLPTASEVTAIITALPMVEADINDQAVAFNLGQFYYDSQVLVQKTNQCRETFAACDAKHQCNPNDPNDADKAKYKECMAKRRECVDPARCLSNYLSQESETNKYKQMYELAEFGVAGDSTQGPVSPPSFVVEKQIAREHDEEEAKFLVQTAASCAIGQVTKAPEGMSRSEKKKFKGEPIKTAADEDACWKTQFSTRSRAETFAKIYESMEKTITATMDSPRSDGKPRDRKKVVTATRKRFSERYVDADRYYNIGVACAPKRENMAKPKKGEDSAWVQCWREQLGLPGNHAHLRSLYNKAFKAAKRRTVINTIAFDLGWTKNLGKPDNGRSKSEADIERNKPIETRKDITRCASKRVEDVNASPLKPEVKARLTNRIMAQCIARARSTLYRDNRRFAEDIVDVAERCKTDKSPAKCWGTGVGGTSRAAKLMKLYDRIVRATEDEATRAALADQTFADADKKFSTDDAKFIVEKGDTCKDDLDCWNARVARRRHKIRVLAAYRLGHQIKTQKDAAKNTLAKYMDDPDFDFRVVILQSINRIAQVGDDVVIKALTDALDKDTALKKSGKKGAGRMIPAMKLALAQFEKPGASK